MSTQDLGSEHVATRELRMFFWGLAFILASLGKRADTHHRVCVGGMGVIISTVTKICLQWMTQKRRTRIANIIAYLQITPKELMDIV